jgi:hypothetical protein
MKLRELRSHVVIKLRRRQAVSSSSCIVVKLRRCQAAPLSKLRRYQSCVVVKAASSLANYGLTTRGDWYQGRLGVQYYAKSST